ncbi:hypothetical protein QYM36_017238 [Artemia franciscana]|uniref:Uncharacterized protein n=1 Tax=Artemia franciscana TaxID=6661 RepID=A0AA88HCU4_ARTSF|nr:hypothetical protein QYM36_017238 [Artemia franciscana]
MTCMNLALAVFYDDNAKFCVDNFDNDKYLSRPVGGVIDFRGNKGTYCVCYIFIKGVKGTYYEGTRSCNLIKDVTESRLPFIRLIQVLQTNGKPMMIYDYEPLAKYVGQLSREGKISDLDLWGRELITYGARHMPKCTPIRCQRKTSKCEWRTTFNEGYIKYEIETKFCKTKLKLAVVCELLITDNEVGEENKCNKKDLERLISKRQNIRKTTVTTESSTTLTTTHTTTLTVTTTAKLTTVSTTVSTTIPTTTPAKLTTATAMPTSTPSTTSITTPTTAYTTISKTTPTTKTTTPTTTAVTISTTLSNQSTTSPNTISTAASTVTPTTNLTIHITTPTNNFSKTVNTATTPTTLAAKPTTTMITATPTTISFTIYVTIPTTMQTTTTTTPTTESILITTPTAAFHTVSTSKPTTKTTTQYNTTPTTTSTTTPTTNLTTTLNTPTRPCSIPTNLSTSVSTITPTATPVRPRPTATLSTTPTAASTAKTTTKHTTTPSKHKKFNPTEIEMFLNKCNRSAEIETIRNSLDKEFLSTYDPELLSKISRTLHDIKIALKLLQELNGCFQIFGNKQRLDNFEHKLGKALKSINDYKMYRSIFKETPRYYGRHIIFYYISFIVCVNFSIIYFMLDQGFKSNNNNLFLS